MPKPKCGRAGTGGPDDGTFKNLKTGGTDRLWNCCMGLPSLIYKSDIGLISEASVHTPGEEVPPSSCSPLAGSCKGAVGILSAAGGEDAAWRFTSNGRLCLRGECALCGVNADLVQVKLCGVNAGLVQVHLQEHCESSSNTEDDNLCTLQFRYSGGHRPTSRGELRVDEVTPRSEAGAAHTLLERRCCCRVLAARTAHRILQRT